MSSEKQVTTKKENLPSASLFEADAQMGFENMKSDTNLAPPILKILQNGSAEAQKRNDKYVEGAEPGMFLNTVTKQLYDGDKGIHVIPCHYKLEYQEWAVYGTGSGRPEMIYPDTSDILEKTKNENGKDFLPNGNYILTVGQHFVIILGKENETALVPMSSTQGKVSRNWNSMMKSISLDGKNGPYTPPSFSHIYKLSSVLNTGKGNQWYGYNVEKVGMLEDANMYERAKKFYEGIKNKA